MPVKFSPEHDKRPLESTDCAQYSEGTDRFHLLQQQLPNISATVLARQLKTL
ncbi:MAG: winged helix-turn-helix transcriptional regulator [Sphingobacterium sp.]|nr:winged helix-turn-helix transcriptional regulator [Sphingobacterium sp.]